MFLQTIFGQRKQRRTSNKRADDVEAQVKDILQKTDQKLILMVRS